MIGEAQEIALAAMLQEARLARAAIAPGLFPEGLSVGEAYRVQHRGIELRKAKGEVLSGLKLGFTSEAKMRQMGVDSVIIGHLTEGMEVAHGGVIDRSAMIHPRVELEVAFRIGADIDFADPNCRLLDHVESVAPALEVIDSRFVGFGFDLGKVIADNTSAAALVVGPWVPWEGRDISALSAELEVRGELVQSSSTSAILGDPVNALAETQVLARLYELTLRAGDVLLAGAVTEAVPLIGGAVIGRIDGLGSVELVGSEALNKGAN